MDRITIDAALSEQLADAAREIPLYDGEGRLLGVFRSEAYRRQLEDAVASCPVSDEELQRRRASTAPGRPLKDILADLERRAS